MIPRPTYYFSSRPARRGEGMGPDCQIVTLWGTAPGMKPKKLEQGSEAGNLADVGPLLVERAQRSGQLAEDAVYDQEARLRLMSLGRWPHQEQS